MSQSSTTAIIAATKPNGTTVSLPMVDFCYLLRSLCRLYDRENGEYPESNYEGMSVYNHALDLLTDQQRDAMIEELNPSDRDKWLAQSRLKSLHPIAA